MYRIQLSLRAAMIRGAVISLPSRVFVPRIVFLSSVFSRFKRSYTSWVSSIRFYNMNHARNCCIFFLLFLCFNEHSGIALHFLIRMNHSMDANHSSFPRNLKLWHILFVTGEGRKGDSQGRLKGREGKGREWSCVKFEFAFFSTVLKMFEGFYEKICHFLSSYAASWSFSQLSCNLAI